MSRSLPERPNLEQLRKQAKNLLKAQRQGDISVCPILRHLTRFAGSSEEDILKARLSLSEAQHALAREYGFKNWAALVRRVRKGSLPGDRWSFIEAAAAVTEATIKEPRPATPFVATITARFSGMCRLCSNTASVHVTERSEGKMVEQHLLRQARQGECLCKVQAAAILPNVGEVDKSAGEYPVKYTVPLSVTQDQIQHHEDIPVTLPDGSIVKLRIPWGVPWGNVDRLVMLAGPVPGAAEKYCVRFVLKLILPPAQR